MTMDHFSEEPLDVREILPTPQSNPDGDPIDIALDRPAVWPVFVAFAATLVLILAMQVVIVAGLMIWLLSQGGDLGQIVKDLPRTVMQPGWFFVLTGANEVVIVGAALVAAGLSREPWGESLGLRRGRLPVWKYAVLAVGSLAPGMAMLGLVHLLSGVIPPDESVKHLYEQMTWEAALPFLAFIALAPGFCEEVLFRGYMQRRLLKRWSPFGAILTTSFLFGALHIMPLTVVFAFGLGLWFGVVAWRVDSIWPTVAGHALINLTLNVFQVGETLGAIADGAYLPSAVGVGVVATICFGASLWILAQTPIRESPNDALRGQLSVAP